MATAQKSIRLPMGAVKEIEALASVAGKDFSGIARDLLTEAVKIRRCPGVEQMAQPGDELKSPERASISEKLSPHSKA